jgi:hypothetical protein
VLAAATVASMAAPCAAQTTPPAADRWTFELTPYLWLSALDGETALPGAPTVELDARFADIIDELDFAAMATLEGRRGSWGFLLDGIYARFSKGGDPGPLLSRAEVKIESGVVTPSVTYRLVDRAPFALDLLAGARMWYSETDIRVTPAGGTRRKFTDNEIWADPIVGGWLRVRLAERWFASLLGDIGGFGLGSDLTWQVFAGIGFKINERFTLHVGYRALAADYENDGFVYDIVQHGPLIGVGIRF